MPCARLTRVLSERGKDLGWREWLRVQEVPTPGAATDGREYPLHWGKRLRIEEVPSGRRPEPSYREDLGRRQGLRVEEMPTRRQGEARRCQCALQGRKRLWVQEMRSPRGTEAGRRI